MTTLVDRRTSAVRPRPGKEAAELTRLRAENARLRKDLAKKVAAPVVLEKTHALLEMLSEGAD